MPRSSSSGTASRRSSPTTFSVTNSAGGGNNSVAFITGPHQEIHAAGDVTLTARASARRLPGGASAFHRDQPRALRRRRPGAEWGHRGQQRRSASVERSATPLANNINIEAGGSVTLNSGAANTGDASAAGRRPADRGHSINAGGAIQLNGTPRSAAILIAAATSARRGVDQRAWNAITVAGTLILHTTGDALLNGANQVGSLSAPGMPPCHPVKASAATCIYQFQRVEPLQCECRRHSDAEQHRFAGCQQRRDFQRQHEPRCRRGYRGHRRWPPGRDPERLRRADHQRRSLAVTSSDGRFATCRTAAAPRPSPVGWRRCRRQHTSVRRLCQVANDGGPARPSASSMATTSMSMARRASRASSIPAARRRFRSPGAAAETPSP